jgi:hypothetical protein
MAMEVKIQQNHLRNRQKRWFSKYQFPDLKTCRLVSSKQRNKTERSYKTKKKSLRTDFYGGENRCATRLEKNVLDLIKAFFTPQSSEV